MEDQCNTEEAVASNLLAEKRGVHDVYNVAAAGSATAATFGLICWLHLKLVEKANEGMPVYSESEQGKGGVGAAIERLDGDLRK